ncbi:MAG: aminopeptidase [Ramlibacter sp.]
MARLALAGAVAAAAVAALCLTGCANVGYYWQSATGHLRLMGAARPVADWIRDGASPEQLKARLALSQRIRSFAVSELHLPDNPSYHRYADLHRSAAVWNVVAAPAFSLKLKTWCFPVTGCVGYHGYFDEASARAEAAQLAGEGFEVSVYPVPAYSTLGWMNWAGGDPLLNTFINYPEGELARLIFHELSHQVVYVNGDTPFNESFATAVERLGSSRWLATQASEAARRDYADYDGRRNQFRALTQSTRRRLAALYAQHESGAIAGPDLLAQKDLALADFRRDYLRLRDSWGGDPARFRAYDRFVQEANNASFGAQAAYDDLVPGFEALFRREQGQWKRFYDAAKRLAALPKEQRDNMLKEMAGA